MPAQDERGRRLALIVGGSDYQDPMLQQLRAPGRDASDLADVLRDPAIGTFHVRILVNTPSDQLLRGIAQFCHQVDPGDLVLVYLSCHGVLDDRGRLYYATINTERALLSATAVAANWLNDQLDDCRARQQILLLDCCHSGAFAKGSKGDDALALQDRFSGRGRVVLTASRATEYSFEGATVVGDGVRSVFTSAVVDGLRTGQADWDKDGLVTVEDLYQYVYATVRGNAESRQTPERWAFGAEGHLVVARSVRGPIIEPAPLPDDVRLLVESSRLVVRESGVKALAELLDHGEPGLVLTARLTLQRISEEDLPRIAALARAAHDADRGQAVAQLEAQERARREAEQQGRRQEAERAAAQGQQIEQLQDQIRDRAATQDWDAVAAASDQLAVLDPAAADPDGLASAARAQIARRQEAEPTPGRARQAADDQLTELGESPQGTAGAQGMTATGQAGTGPVVGPGTAPGRVDDRTVSRAGDDHAPPATGVAERSLDQQRTAATGIRIAGHAIPRRLVVIAAATCIAVIGLVAAIIITATSGANSRVRWTYNTGDQVYSSPAVAGGTVYVGGEDGNVYALGAATGHVLWSYTTGAPVDSSPAVAGGTVYVGSWDDKVYALGAATGQVLWSYTTGAEVDSSPAVAGGTVYVGSDDDRMYALDASTGHVLWSYTTGGPVDDKPAVAAGTVYIGSDDGKVYALDAATGHLLWTYATGSPTPPFIGAQVTSSPAVAGGTVYVGSDGGKVCALDAATGHVLWTYTTGDPVESSPAVAGGTVYVGSNDDKVYALDAATGHVLWTYTTGDPVESSPAVAGGTVYVGSDDDKVYALDAATGHVLWTYTTGGQVDSSPAVAGGTVYVGSNDVNVYALKVTASLPSIRALTP